MTDDRQIDVYRESYMAVLSIHPTGVGRNISLGTPTARRWLLPGRLGYAREATS